MTATTYVTEALDVMAVDVTGTNHEGLQTVAVKMQVHQKLADTLNDAEFAFG